MTGEVIKEFLVGLGFGVDDASLAKFNKSIASAAFRVTALYAAIKVAAAGIFFSISKISEGFEQMGYEYRIIAPAINKALILRQALLSAYRAAGIDIVKAVQQSVLFNYSLTKTKYALEAIYKSVGLKFLPILTQQMDKFRSQIYANMPKIQASLEKMVGFIFRAFEATVILGERVWSILGRVWEFFIKLDEATNGWSTRIVGFIAVWKLLNLSFLATPLGAILGGLVALLALFDDFETWKEGGKSLFDWSSFVPIIDAVKNAVGGVVWVFVSLNNVIVNLFNAIERLFTGDLSGFFNLLAVAGNNVTAIFSNLWKVISGIGSALGGLNTVAANGLVKLFGAATSAGPLLQSVQQPAPLGNSQSAGVSQRVSQEPNILVQGSADATATGKAVAAEQGKVNFDLTRNLKSATQ